MIETLQTFWESRRPWLEPRVEENREGGYDVVVRIDGSYLSYGEALLQAALYRQRLANLGLITERPRFLEDLSR